MTDAVSGSGVDRAVPVFVGSGVTAETIGDCFAAGADGAIVGTALKEGGETTNQVSEDRVRRVVAAARDAVGGSD